MLDFGHDEEDVFKALQNMKRFYKPVNTLVILSGGMDSAVCLGIADYLKTPETNIGCITFDYGQPHDKEIIRARELGWHYDANVKTINLHGLADNFKTALSKSSDIKIPDHSKSGVVPATYVPFRNAIFLTIACGYAESWGYDRVIYGANAVDYSGYPDCRPAFVDAINMVAYSYETKIQVEAPIIYLSKADIVRLGNKLQVPFEKTWSCHRGLKKASNLTETFLVNSAIRLLVSDASIARLSLSGCPSRIVEIRRSGPIISSRIPRENRESFTPFMLSICL